VHFFINITAKCVELRNSFLQKAENCFLTSWCSM